MAAPLLPPGADARLAEALAAYVPPLVLENLAARAEPRATTFEGAVLLTDIAGFTTLTERLDGAGPAGVEELSRLLNAYFTDLIDLVETHGGLVLKFAGDALLAVWPGGDAPPAETVQRAAHCALFIQRQMHARPVGEELELSMRVSLGAGAITHLVVGGGGARWASRLAGPALAGARAAIAHAAPGEVALSPEVAALLSPTAKTTAQPGGGARLEAVAPVAIHPVLHPWVQARDIAALYGHVPAAVRERIAAGQAGWLAEFRSVSVVFINVPEVDDDPARRLERTQTVTATVQAALAHFGGTLDNLGDDHAGLTLVAAFGLPGWSHEDDAVRAVRLALAVRTELRALGLASAIGVTTGRLFCGAVGSPRRRAYSMVGDAMNRCARLMGLAENDVLADEATRRAAARSLRFEFLRTGELRGKTGAVALYRALGEAAARDPGRRGMIGRETERSLLQERLAALRAGGVGGVLLIEGEAGIGKSTLLAELRALAAETGVDVLGGSGDSLERASSYHAWQRVFGELLGFAPEADEAERSDLLRRALAALPERENLAPLLNPALGLDLPDNELTAEMSGQSRREATTDLLVQLLAQATAREPLAVVLEDAHWADSASWGLALEVHRRVPRLLLTLATRPLTAPVPEAWPALCEAAGPHRLALGPLVTDDVETLLRQRLAVDFLAPAVVEFIRAKAEGHPFFSEELAYALRDAGHLVIRARRGELAPGVRDLRSLNFPANVQGVVRERIDRLEPREQLAIKVASVNGRTFSLPTLHAIHPVAEDGEHLPACLERLVALDLAQRTGGEGDAVFSFKHNIIQEVAYGQLLFAQRQQLHRRLAEYLGGQDAANYPLLAHHWRNTDTPARAIHFLNLAGEQALRRFANREAIGFIEQAIELASTGGERPGALALGRWHRQIGEAHHHLGRMEESRRWLEQAARILGWPVPAPRRLKTLALPAAAARQLWHRLRGGGRAGRGVHDPAALAEAVEAHSQLGEIAYFTNDLVTAVYHIIHGLNLAEALGPSPKLAEMSGGMMILTGALPPAALGELYYRRSEEALALVERAVTRAYVELLMGIFFNGRGSWARAQERLGLALLTFRRYGNGRRMEECFTNLFYLHLFRGEYGAAREAVTELRRSATRREDAQTLGWAAALEGHLLLPTEGPAAALRALGEAGQPGWDALAHTAFHAGSAVAHLRLGDWERARSQARTALERLTAAPPVSYTALLDHSYVAEVFCTLLARAQREGTPPGELPALARRATAAMRTYSRSFSIGQARVHFWTGMLRHLGGRRGADALWRKGLAAATRLAMPGDRALLHAQRAVLLGESERAAAAELFSALGAHAELARWPLAR